MIAPVVEETGKGLFLVIVVVFRRAQIHGLLDGLIYGALVGVGFAFVEDILYYLSSLDSGALGVTFFLRGDHGTVRASAVHLGASASASALRSPPEGRCCG